MESARDGETELEKLAHIGGQKLVMSARDVET